MMKYIYMWKWIYLRHTQTHIHKQWQFISETWICIKEHRETLGFLAHEQQWLTETFNKSDQLDNNYQVKSKDKIKASNKWMLN